MSLVFALSLLASGLLLATPTNTALHTAKSAASQWQPPFAKSFSATLVTELVRLDYGACRSGVRSRRRLRNPLSDGYGYAPYRPVP